MIKVKDIYVSINNVRQIYYNKKYLCEDTILHNLIIKYEFGDDVVIGVDELLEYELWADRIMNAINKKDK